MGASDPIALKVMMKELPTPQNITIANSLIATTRNFETKFTGSFSTDAPLEDIAASDLTFVTFSNNIDTSWSSSDSSKSPAILRDRYPSKEG